MEGDGVRVVQLHGGWHSPFVKRVQMALKMKGVNSYEYVEQDLKDKSPQFLSINPKGTVPTVVDKGEVILESLIILKHIDQAFPGPSIFPRDTSLLDAIDTEVIIPCWNVFWKEGKESEMAKDKAIKGLKILEQEIEGKKLFGGDNIGLVDVVACFIAYGVPVLQDLTGIKLLTQDEFPCLLKWVRNYYNDPLTKEYFPTNDPLAKEYFPPEGPLSASYKVGLQTKDRPTFYKAAFLQSQSRRPI